jgi:sterol desaturase/sphingolipid hydroxylase (fatty acid hydroxylase superfamily)
MGYPDPTLYALPFFGVTLLLEPLLLRRQAKRGRRVAGYEARDRNASLGMGVGSLVFVTGINLVIFALAGWLARYRVVDLGTGAVGWAVALVGWDFAYYWHHRFEHRVRLLWACHVNHHSSRYYNLSTALRQPWTPFAGLVLYPPLALLGVAPWMIMVSGGLNLVYQYWIHTEAIDRMPGWFEAVLNTPSHHRVHHGSNPEYLDKNYAGVLILWDRLFGTFEPERAPVVYGLTKNIETFNLLEIAFHEYAAIARDVRDARGLRERIGVLVHGPEWRAAGSVAGAMTGSEGRARASVPPQVHFRGP